ncbi:MAG: PEP-CTERM system TPR-repeat protein PrsT [Rubrivivax sp.]|nr:PEP-CTERM system TPR-repeat protein PrsT [Rubrivivax sp.]
MSLNPGFLITAAALALALLAGCGAKDPASRLAEARALLEKNDVAAATIEVKNALQADPNHGEARFLLGSLLLRQGDAAAAEIELRKARAAGHPDDVVVPELARALLVNRQAGKVVEEFASLRFGKPEADASLQTTLAGAQGVLGNAVAAAAAIESALLAVPGHAPALMLKARLLAAAGDPGGALAVVDDIVARDAGHAEAWKFKGDLLRLSGAPADDALAAYRRAAEAQPGFADAQLAISALLMERNQLDDAAQQVDKLKAQAPNSARTRYAEAQLAYRRGDFRQARELALQLLGASARNARYLELAAAVEFQLGALAQAEAYASGALAAAPELRLARRVLVASHLRSGQPAKALAAIVVGPDRRLLDPGLLPLAGQAYLQTGDVKRAQEAFAQALKQDPADAGRRTALALSRLAGGEAEAAFDQLQDIAKADSGISADLALVSAHLARREWDQALAAVDRVQAKQPGQPLAADLRARVHQARGNTAAARESFEQALRLAPTYFPAVVGLAGLDLAERRPDAARRRFDELLSRDPKNLQAMLARAEVAAAAGAGAAEVADLLGEAIKAHPGELRPRLMLVESWLRAGDRKQAESAAQTAVAALPSSPELLEALGRVQLETGAVQQAVSIFHKLVAMQPLVAAHHVRLAAAQRGARELPAAEQSLRKALELQPDDPAIQRALIMVQLDAGQAAAAQAVAREIQVRRPREAIGFLAEGDLHVLHRNWDAAIRAYRAGLQAVPDATDLAVNLHATQVAAGRATDAEQFAAGWMRARPRDVRFLVYLGDVALQRNELVTAEQRYRAAVQAQPDNAIALNNLAWVLHLQRKPGGLPHAERAHQLAPAQPAFMDTLATLLSGSGEHQRAIALQSQALRVRPGDPALRLNLARVYLAAGDKGKAKTELEQLARMGDRHPAQDEVQRLLKTL